QEVSGKEKSSDQNARAKGSGRILPVEQGTVKNEQQANGRQRKAKGQKQNGGDARQRVLHQDEGASPDQRNGYQREVGARAAHFPFPGGRISGSRNSNSRVSRIRFRPRSRPSGLYHSCVVWAPPPCPPAPIAIAGIPSDSGMLASVDEQS